VLLQAGRRFDHVGSVWFHGRSARCTCVLRLGVQNVGIARSPRRLDQRLHVTVRHLDRVTGCASAISTPCARSSDPSPGERHLHADFPKVPFQNGNRSHIDMSAESPRKPAGRTLELRAGHGVTWQPFSNRSRNANRSSITGLRPSATACELVRALIAPVTLLPSIVNP